MFSFITVTSSRVQVKSRTGVQWTSECWIIRKDTKNIHDAACVARPTQSHIDPQFHHTADNNKTHENLSKRECELQHEEFADKINSCRTVDGSGIPSVASVPADFSGVLAQSRGQKVLEHQEYRNEQRFGSRFLPILSDSHILILSSYAFRYKNEYIEYALRRTPRELLGISKNIFCWVIASVSSLTKKKLFEALALNSDPSATSLNRADPDVLRVCEEKFGRASADLVTFDPSGGARFIDKDIEEYLTSGTSVHRISFADAAEQNAISCINYISRGNMTADLQSSSRDRQSISRHHIEHWVTYIRMAETHGKAMGGFVYRLILENPVSYGIWGLLYSALTGQPIRHMELSEPFIFAARFGLLGYALMHLKMGRDPRVAFNGQTVADLAWENGHRDVAKLLYSTSHTSCTSCFRFQ